MKKEEESKLDSDLIDENYVPEAEDFLENKGQQIDKKKKKTNQLFKKVIVSVLVIALFANVIQFFPKVWNLDVFRFLQTSYELSKNDDIENLKETIVSIRSDNGSGTGFVIDNEGVIITNHHVIDKATNPYIHFRNNTFYEPQKIVSFEELDIAIIKIEDTHSLEVAPLQEKDNIKKGETIYVIGNPLSFARIANEGKIIGETTALGIDGPVILIDAPIYKGNSGSPLFNAEGEVIGVIFATRITDEYGKVGLAIPLSSIRGYIKEF